MLKWLNKINIRQQERIAKVVTAYTQVIENIILHKAPGISYINSPISDYNKTTLNQVILNLKRLTEETKDKIASYRLKKTTIEISFCFARKNFIMIL